MNNYLIITVFSLMIVFSTQSFSSTNSDSTIVKDSTTKLTTSKEPVKNITVPAGTKFSISITNQLATNRSVEGSTFSANLTDDFKLDSIIVSPKNSLVIGKIVKSKRGEGLGDAKLIIQVTEITVNGQLISVVTDPISVDGEHKRNAEAEIPAGTIEQVTLKQSLVIK